MDLWERAILQRTLDPRVTPDKRREFTANSPVRNKTRRAQVSQVEWTEPKGGIVGVQHKVGDRVKVHLAEHCDEPEAWSYGVIDFVFPGGKAFTIKFDDLRTEVVAAYEIQGP